jgi:hypothetical protein
MLMGSVLRELEQLVKLLFQALLKGRQSPMLSAKMLLLMVKLAHNKCQALSCAGGLANIQVHTDSRFDEVPLILPRIFNKIAGSVGHGSPPFKSARKGRVYYNT